MSTPPDRAKTIVIWVVAIALFMEMLDSSVLNTALPPIAQSLHDNPIDLKLALTAYLLSVGIFIPMSGWLSDRIGPHRCLQLAILLFCVGSLGCACSVSLPMLVIFRIIQGIGGAFLTPTGRTVMIRLFGRDGVVSAMAKISAISIIGPTLGPLLGGFFATYLTWRLIFIINLPMGIAGFWLIQKHFPAFEVPEKRRFDFWGFFLLGIGLSSLLYVLDVIVTPAVSLWLKVGGFCVFLLCTLLYGVHMRHATAPILSGAILRIKRFRYYAWGSFLMRLPLTAIPFLVPLYLQTVHQFTAFFAGFLTIPMMGGALISKRFIPILDRLFPRATLIVICSGFSFLCMVGIAILSLHFNVWWMCLALLLNGIAASTQFTLVNSSAYAGLEEDTLSQGSTIYSMVIQVGMSFGIAIAGIVLAASVGPHLSHTLPASAFAITFWLQTVLLLIATLWFIWVRRQLRGLV